MRQVITIKGQQHLQGKCHEQIQKQVAEVGHSCYTHPSFFSNYMYIFLIGVQYCTSFFLEFSE